MMRRAAILIAIQLISAAVCLCQIKIPLVDISAAGSPIRISGKVSFQDNPTTVLRYSYQPDGSMTNVSNKGIMLTVIHISASGVDAPDLDNSIAVDRFLGPNILDTGREERIDPTRITFGSVASVRPRASEANSYANSSATAQVVFVQFTDGSFWGDLDVGREQLSLREKTLLKLNELENVLDEKGGLGLKDELSRIAPFQFLAIDVLASHCADKETSCLANGLRNILSDAHRHQAEMKPANPVLIHMTSDSSIVGNMIFESTNGKPSDK